MEQRQRPHSDIGNAERIKAGSGIRSHSFNSVARSATKILVYISIYIYLVDVKIAVVVFFQISTSPFFFRFLLLESEQNRS